MYQDMIEETGKYDTNGISEPAENDEYAKKSKHHKVLPHLAERREYSAKQYANTEEEKSTKSVRKSSSSGKL